MKRPQLFAHRPYWAKRFGTASFLPTSRQEMDELGWDSCDVILVNGDAYVDHPSFGGALIGRLLEAHGFRVGMLDQPDWNDVESFRALGEPNLMFGITAGNMDSMVNHYTADRKIRSDDAYTAGGLAGARPDRAAIVYTQRCQEAYRGKPVIIGGIEASLRRTAHYDYWSDKIRRSALLDSKADLLVYGSAERAIVELVHRLANGESIDSIRDLRGTAFIGMPETQAGETPWLEIDSTTVDRPGPVAPPTNPYEAEPSAPEPSQAPLIQLRPKVTAAVKHPRERTAIRIPSYETVRTDKVLYAHASRVVHRESNPANARALVQRHGKRDLWINPPPIPLTTEEFDSVFELPFKRVPHPRHGDGKISAYEMIRFSVMIMRGCFGGCTFCSITEHEGRRIQSRSESSVLREIERIKDTPGFTGTISDLGGPTANMYRLGCKDPKIEDACRKPSCVYPGICENLHTDHAPLIQLYRKARAIPGVKRILVASGLRYDLAVESPEYVKELVSHHVGGYLKIAPEHTETGTLTKMMKPGIGTYDRFKELFDRYSAQAGKEQYLIPYFIAAHPGTTDEDMMNLALWLKGNGFRADQVQAFLPSPMSTAGDMYYSGKNPLKRVHRDSEDVETVRGLRARRLHKAFLRYHDANNWPVLREALTRMGREDLIGNSKRHLIPTYQPAGTGLAHEGQRSKHRSGQRQQPFRTTQTRPSEGHAGVPALNGSSDTRNGGPQHGGGGDSGRPAGSTKTKAGGKPGASRPGSGRSGPKPGKRGGSRATPSATSKTNSRRRAR